MEEWANLGLVVHGVDEDTGMAVRWQNLKRAFRAMVLLTIGMTVLIGAVLLTGFVLFVVTNKALTPSSAQALFLRWLVLIVGFSAVPATMLLALLLVPRFIPRVFGLLSGGLLVKLRKQTKEIKECATSALEAGERIVAHCMLDEFYGPYAWGPSLYCTYLALVSANAAIVVSAFWGVTESIHSFFFAPLMVISFIGLVWSTDLVVGFDRFMGLMLHGMIPLLTFVLWRITPHGFDALRLPCIGFLVVQGIIIIVKIGKARRQSCLLFTNGGMRRLSMRLRLFPFPRSVPDTVGPLFRATEIKVAAAPNGERWTASTDGGSHRVFYPVFAAARTVAEHSKQAGKEYHVRLDEHEAGMGFGVLALVLALVWGCWLCLVCVPPAHYAISVFNDLFPVMDQIADEPAEPLRRATLIAKHHPVALLFSSMATQALVMQGKLAEAKEQLAHVEALVEVVPSSLRNDNSFGDNYLVRARGELQLRLRLRDKVPRQGWEPKGKALKVFRQAMLHLFSEERRFRATRPRMAKTLLDKVTRLDSDAVGPRFMYAYMLLKHSGDIGDEDAIPSLKTVEQRVTKATARARTLLQRHEKKGPWQEAARKMTALSSYPAQRTLFLILLNEFIQKETIPSWPQVESHVKAIARRKRLSLYCFLSYAFEPPRTATEFLARWHVLETAFVGSSWQGLDKKNADDLRRWFAAMLKSKSWSLPKKLAAKVAADPSLAWLNATK